MLEVSYSEDTIYMKMYITMEPLWQSPRSNKLFLFTPVIVEYKALQKNLDIS